MLSSLENEDNIMSIRAKGMRAIMKTIPIVIITIALLFAIGGCSKEADNRVDFDVVNSNATIWEDDRGEHLIILCTEVKNIGKNPLRLKESDFDIVDENGTIIDTIKLVPAYPPILESGESAVYCGKKSSDTISKTSVTLKVIPHIESEKSNIKLTTLPIDGSWGASLYSWGHVRNLSSVMEYNNIQIAIISRAENDKVVSVMIGAIESIKPGEKAEYQVEEHLLQRDYGANTVIQHQYLAYLAPDTTEKIEESYTGRDIIAFICFLLIFGSAIGLQILISRKRNKWFGLIIPSINLLISFIPVFPLLQEIDNFLPRTIDKIDEFGNIISSATVEATEGLWQFIFMVISVFLIHNISTLIFMIIYWVCQRKERGNMK